MGRGQETVLPSIREAQPLLDDFLVSAERVETTLVDFQKNQGRKEGEGIDAALFSPDERKRFLDEYRYYINSYHLFTHNSGLSSEKGYSALFGMSDEKIGLQHDISHTDVVFNVFPSVIRNQIDEIYEGGGILGKSLWEILPLGEPAFVRHTIRVFQSYFERLFGRSKESKSVNLGLILSDIAVIFQASNEFMRRDCVNKQKTGRSTSPDYPMGMRIVIDFSDVDEVVGSENDLYRIFYNLARNSQKALTGRFMETGQTGTLTIRTDEDENSVLVSVSDDGPGINVDVIVENAIKGGLINAETVKALNEQEKLNLIFKEGVSGSGSTGIGLWYCQKVIEEHGGTINVESILGQGAKFTIVLPR